MSHQNEGGKKKVNNDERIVNRFTHYIKQIHYKFKNYCAIKKKEYSKDPAGHKVARATYLLVFVTFVLVIIASLQWCSLERTDETARLRDRAFLYFGDPQIVRYPPQKITVWGITLPVSNAGNMPAQGVEVQYSCPTLTADQNVKDPHKIAHWEIAEISSVVGPKQSFGLQSCNIRIEDIAAARDGNKKVFFLMKVTYFDGFSENSRITKMTRNLRFDDAGGYSLGFYGPHNCSDDDCPND